jgi:hypothetical protein
MTDNPPVAVTKADGRSPATGITAGRRPATSAADTRTGSGEIMRRSVDTTVTNGDATRNASIPTKSDPRRIAVKERQSGERRSASITQVGGQCHL